MTIDIADAGAFRRLVWNEDEPCVCIRRIRVQASNLYLPRVHTCGPFMNGHDRVGEDDGGKGPNEDESRDAEIQRRFAVTTV